ncbi:MAG: penicillin-binding protein 1C [Gammaproteobacteria bacterium]|nr:penicillin-binding protein 1C [Gammaproteobacteria bacterium]
MRHPRRAGVALAALAATGLGAARHLDSGDVGYHPESVRRAHASSDARLLDRHGELLHELRVDPHGRRLDWIGIEGVSPALVAAVIAAEDRRFAEHRGVDWRSAAAAPATGPGVIEGRRGASTITMQLAALVDSRLAPAGRRGVADKWRQMRAALAIERRFNKDEVLEAYLNLASFRGELQGIAAAARGLFDKTPDALTIDEAVVLASLLRAPNADAALVAARACGLARRLEGERPCAGIESLVAANLDRTQPLAARATLAPHVARRLLRPGESAVRSTLDADLQRLAADALAATLAELGERGVADGAVLVVDNAGAEVRAYLGNGGPGASSAWHVDGVEAPRQAGSTLKPLLYAMAFEHRYLTAASLLDDSPLDLVTPTGAWVPANYDRAFRGRMSARTALAGSVNIPAVRTLMLLGVDAFADRLRHAGFEHVVHDGEYYGYALALGSAEVTLWQLAAAYRALADGGLWQPLTLVPRQGEAPKRRILDATAAFIVSDILADRAARAGSFGLDNVLALPFAASVKTGTSKDMRDNWSVGYSSRYTVAVWVGNFDGRAMRGVSGVSGAAPLWARIMGYLHRDDAPPAPLPPPGIEAVAVHFEPPVEPPRREWFVGGTAMDEVVSLAPASRPPRIAYPGPGMIMAVDGDIPAANQRVHFSADRMPRTGRWRIDGVATVERWTPVPGSHRLELVDGDGAVLDEVRFTVRGRASSPQAQAGGSVR